MKESLLSFGSAPTAKWSAFRLAKLLAVTAVTLACPLVLPRGEPPFLCYIPLLLAVIVNSLVGGLWLSEITQVVGGLTIFFLAAHPFSGDIRSSQVWTVIGFFLVARVVTSLVLTRRYAHILQHTSEQLELIAQVTHDCIWDWDLKTGRVWRGGKAREIFGYSMDQVVPEVQWWLSHVDPAQSDDVWASLQQAISGPADRWDREYRLRQESGSFITVSDRARILRNEKGIATHVVGVMADISAERRAEERLIHSASHDLLTGIANRSLFLHRLETAAVSGSARAVLFLDLDYFKQVNDSYGHQIGDQLLIAVCNRITMHLRAQDLAARFGGDEFTILLNDLQSSHEALERAEEILSDLQRPFQFDHLELSISASIGIAYGHSGPALALVQQSDSAMYQAKRQGRGHCQIFDPGLENRTRVRLQREVELRQAFHNGSLQLYYQPIVSLADGSLTSFEALLRWRHARLGIILPADILPVAESAGLSIALGKWVVRQSVDRLREWRENGLAGSLDINFNLSGPEFIRPELISDVKEILRETGIPGESLIIELTETTIMESNVDAAQRLSQLRDMGIRLALDDFGKGHSSLGRLQDFPISILKIDGSFVKQIGTEKRQILDAIIALAHELKLEITAEGVETSQQLVYLRDKGAAKVQGLLFSPALSLDSATGVLLQQPWDLRQFTSQKERSSGFAAG